MYSIFFLQTFFTQMLKNSFLFQFKDGTSINKLSFIHKNFCRNSFCVLVVWNEPLYNFLGVGSEVAAAPKALEA